MKTRSKVAFILAAKLKNWLHPQNGFDITQATQSQNKKIFTNKQLETKAEYENPSMYWIKAELI